MIMFPVRGNVYSAKEILEMNLRDSPFWEVPTEFGYLPVQDSHLTEAELMGVEHWPESRWVFLLETDEWIPVFRYAKGQRPVSELVDMKPIEDDHSSMELFITPKGKPLD